MSVDNKRGLFRQWFYNWINRPPKCKHAYKTISTEYLESYSRMYNECGRVEIGYFDTYYHKRACIICGKDNSFTTSEHVPWPKTKCTRNY